jgi:ribosomal-protein-alanine N-acetyltransferase
MLLVSIVRIVHLNNIPIGYAEELAQILNVDTKLQIISGSQKVKTTGNEFITFCKEWSYSRNADMFAIVLDKLAIGTISLSHQDRINHKAQIGYWLSSNYWGKGYTSEAFSLVLSFARLKGIEYVSASIIEDNLVSKRIWERYGAIIKLNNGKYQVSIDLQK